MLSATTVGPGRVTSLLYPQNLLTSRNTHTRALLRVLVQYRLMTARVIVAIYVQALILWPKRCLYVPHSGSSKAEVSP
jgi:DUF1365 family protein